MESTVNPTGDSAQAIPLGLSANGRASGKSWKSPKQPTPNLSTKAWDTRMRETTRRAAVKKLETELKEEKRAEILRRQQIRLQRKKAAEERQRLEQEKARELTAYSRLVEMGAKKAARMRRKAGRTKKVNG